MDKYEKKYYSCYCLFDVCCLSKAQKEEDFPTFGKKIRLFLDKKCDKIMKLGQCTYADYHTLRFSSTNVWILREISHIQEAINIYAVCREFYTKRIKNLLNKK